MRTPSQTVGPFFSFGLCDRPAGTIPGGDLRVHGLVLDGAGEPVPDSLVEIWSPDGGFGRCGTGRDGGFELVVRRVPHYEVMVFARGLLKHCATRMYLPGGELDDLLAALPEERRSTLLAEEDEDGSLRFDIHLQGERETVFFAL
jgi:protocatechuate 3,4-dioxygenase, alpha subunit